MESRLVDRVLAAHKRGKSGFLMKSSTRRRNDNILLTSEAEGDCDWSLIERKEANGVFGID
jgi:hypothetical protein